MGANCSGLFPKGRKGSKETQKSRTDSSCQVVGCEKKKDSKDCNSNQNEEVLQIKCTDYQAGQPKILTTTIEKALAPVQQSPRLIHIPNHRYSTVDADVVYHNLEDTVARIQAQRAKEELLFLSPKYKGDNWNVNSYNKRISHPWRDGELSKLLRTLKIEQTRRERQAFR